ncbi:unnamed protein product, partial [Ectocarpus sp. 8 AP-2014]
ARVDNRPTTGGRHLHQSHVCAAAPLLAETPPRSFTFMTCSCSPLTSGRYWCTIVSPPASAPCSRRVCMLMCSASSAEEARGHPKVLAICISWHLHATFLGVRSEGGNRISQPGARRFSSQLVATTMC